MIEIKEIDFEIIKSLKNKVSKEQVSLDNNEYATWFGLFENSILAGFTCVVIKGTNARYKSDYIFDEHRNKGYYNMLFIFRHQYTLQHRPKVKTITAFCTRLSRGTFMRFGFTPINANKNNVTFVKLNL